MSEFAGAVQVKLIYRARKAAKAAMDDYVDRRDVDSYARLVSAVKYLGQVVGPHEEPAKA